MSLRRGHGKGAGAPRIEVLPPDELPEGVPGGAVEQCPDDFDEHGRFAAGNKLAAAGGRARTGHTKLAKDLSLAKVTDGDDFAPYRRAAVSFRRAQVTELARNVGGGVCGPAPSSMVASAALQLAMSRYLADRGGRAGDVAMMTQASRLADASRQNLLAAHELCAQEAIARKRVAPIPAWWTNPSAPAAREPVPPTRQDGAQDVDEDVDDADDLSEPLARLRACRGPHGASDDDDDEGEVIR